MTKIQQISVALAVMLGLLVPAFAFAQSANVTASVTANAGGASVNASATTTAKLTAAEVKAQQRGDQEITRRTTALNALVTRISQMQEVSDSFKAGLTVSVQNEISTLAALQTKIDADADLATLKTDVQSITANYRVFMLILPQARIAAAADRVVTLTSMFSSLGSKLQARLQAAAQAGSDTTALTAALNDIAAKISDAQTQAQAAVSATASLQPDNGDTTVKASNTAALKQGKADIDAAQKDLVAARKDVGTIVAGLAKLPSASASVNASSTTSTQ